MMIEVFTLEDKEKLIKKGLNYICSRKIESGEIFIFEYRKDLNFDLSDIKFKPTNKLFF